MNLRQNPAGVLAFILAFLSSCLMLAPAIISQTAGEDLTQRTFEDVLTDAAVDTGRAVLERTQQSAQDSYQNAREAVRDRVTQFELGERFFGDDEGGEEAAALEPAESPPQVQKALNVTDWRAASHRAGLASGVIALFAAAGSFIRREDRLLSKTVFVLSLGALAAQFLVLMLGNSFIAVGILALAALIVYTTHLLARAEAKT